MAEFVYTFAVPLLLAFFAFSAFVGCALTFLSGEISELMTLEAGWLTDFAFPPQLVRYERTMTKEEWIEMEAKIKMNFTGVADFANFELGGWQKAVQDVWTRSLQTTWGTAKDVTIWRRSAHRWTTRFAADVKFLAECPPTVVFVVGPNSPPPFV